MNKQELDFLIKENIHISPMYSLMKTTPTQGKLPEIAPGQFV